MVYDPIQPTSSTQADNQRRIFWLRQAVHLQRKVNVARWLQSFLPALCGLSFVISCLLVLERYLFDQSRYVWAVYGVTVCVCALTCLILVQKYFFSTGEALVQLDVVMQLHNRLSSAFAGIGEWPQVTDVHDGLRWRWGQTISPVLFSVVVLAMAFWIPIRNAPAIFERPTHKPLAWTDMALTLEHLEQSDIVQHKAIDHLQAQLWQLENQPPQHWYSHSTLEATDALRQQMDHALAQLAQQLQQMASVVSKLERQAPDAGTPALQDLSAQFAQTLDGLSLGRMPLGEQHLKLLQRIDPHSLKGLSREELAHLKETLRNGMATLREMPGHGRQGYAGNEPGQDGFSENEPGQGGIDRGPGTAPLTLSPRPGFGGLDRLEVVRGADEPDTNEPYITSYSVKQPDADRAQPHSITPGGTARVQGDGGAAVWKHTFTPDEREVLQRVFK